MSMKIQAIGGIAEEPLYTAKPFNGKEIPIVASYHNVHGVWRNVVSTTATITTIATPNQDGYMVVTYLEVSADKNNNGVVSIQLTDGANTEVLFARNLANEPLVAEIDFSNSRVAGWRNARIEMVTVGAAFEANAFVAYTKLPEGDEYSDWTAKR